MIEHPLPCPPEAADIQLIFWDLGDVLVTLDYEQLFGRICPLLSTTPKDFHRVLFRTGAFDRVNRGQTTPREFHEEVQEALEVCVAYDAFAAAWQSFFQPRPEMGELLAALSSRVPMWLLSNTDPLHHQACQRQFEYLTHLTGQLTSYGLGAMKPEPAIYRRALTHVGVEASAALFFDDKPENIEGARAEGLHAHLFTDAIACKETLRAYGL